MKRIVKIVGIVLVLLLVVGVSAAWYLNHSTPDASYRTVPARHADIVATISATGTIVPEDVIDVGAQVNGQIASFGKDVDGKIVDYRSSVKKDMVLALIDDALFQADVATAAAQLAQAKAQVAVNEANRDQAKAHLDQTQRDWDRAQKLSGSPALSATDYDTARANYEQAVASLAMAEANIVQARAAINMADASVLRARRNLAYCTIASPVDGVILDRRVEIGQTVVASLSAPSLFLLAKDLRRMEVLVQVNEADIGHVQPGQGVTFVSDAYPNETFHGVVRKVRLNATQTQNVVTYTVEILTENPDLKLLPYLTANVTFEVARRENVLAVPNAALRWSPREAVRAAMRAAGKDVGDGGRESGGARDLGSPAQAAAAAAPAQVAAAAPARESNSSAAAALSASSAAPDADKTAPGEASKIAPSDENKVAAGDAGNAASRGSRRDWGAGSGREGGRGRSRDSARSDAAKGDATKSDATRGDSTAATASDPSRGGPAADASGKPSERGSSRPSFVWVQSSDGSLRRVRVRTGLTDGTLTEIVGDALADGDEVIVGEKTAQAAGPSGTPENTNPFMPQVFRNNNNRRAGTAPGAPQQPGVGPTSGTPPPAR
jgi:HlyD family secretion protein